MSPSRRALGSDRAGRDAALAAARQALAAGRAAEAVALVSDVRRRAPDDAEALALLGRALLRCAPAARARAALARAVAAAPDQAPVLANLATALRRTGDEPAAESALMRALAIEPASAELRVNLGNLLRAAGRAGAAGRAFRKAVVLRPDLPEAWFGAALCGADGIAALRRTLVLRPDFVDAHAALAAALLAAGRADEAAAVSRTALLLDPADPVAWARRGQAGGEPRAKEAALRRAWRLAPGTESVGLALASLMMQEWRWVETETLMRRLLCLEPGSWPVLVRYVENRSNRTHHAVALLWARRALRLRPDQSSALAAVVAALIALGRCDEARMLLRRALVLRPDDLAAHLNTSAVLVEQRAWAGAEALMRRVLRLAPELGLAWYSLGVALKNQGRTAEALAAYEEGKRLLPDSPRERFNRAVALLATGNAEEGLAEYEWRWHLTEFPSGRQLSGQPSFPQPVWQGESLAGRRILVWGEQGIGDELWDAGYLPAVLEQAAGCVVECEPRLVPLFQRSFPAAEVVERTAPADPRTLTADLQCPMGSLALRTGAVAGPRRPAYLRADPDLVARLRQRYRRTGGPVVGISWRSRKPKAHRSFAAPLADWTPVLALPGINLVSLQYGDVSDDAEWIRRHRGVDLMVDPEIDALRDLDSFAAQVAACDAVVSIANSTVAMAAALGRPVFAVLRHDQDDWRYTLGSERSAWLPTVRAFWPTGPDDWAGPLARAAAALADMVREPGDSAIPRGGV